MNYSYFKLSHMAMILALCGILPACSKAAPPAAPVSLSASEQDYITARDKAIAEFTALETRQGTTQAMQDAVRVREKKVLADLQRHLSAIIGPLAAVPGIPSANTINLGGLCRCDEIGDADHSGLDGLRSSDYSPSSGGVYVQVSTRGLTEHWLHGKKDLASALKTANFYDEVFGGADGHYLKIMSLTLKKPEGVDTIYAQFGFGTNGPDYGNYTGDSEVITMGVIKGNRVLVANARVKAAVPQIASCAVKWNAMPKASKKDNAIAEYQYQSCMEQKLPHTSAFPALVAQAQKLANNLARL